ncbi:MAG: MbcA/ParS/Xre antitoxin family protein [Gammaproteobacteria bacterium]|nr:MbcA/ParS/Xre antitoxin family protein [Gammaproteobacteria bacterium]
MATKHVSATDRHDRNSRQSLARMVINLFDHWKLPPDERLILLGLNPESRTSLKRYRKGDPLSDNRDLLDRVSHLLAIHKSLRIIFPQNRELAYKWMSSRNNNFQQITPVEAIKQYGFTGLLMVRSYLDRERGR